MPSRRGWLFLSGVVVVVASILVVAVVAGSDWLSRPMPLRLEARALSATEFHFEPARLVAPSHTAVSLTFSNRTQAPHTLVLLPPIDLRSGVIVQPELTDRLEFTTPGPGEYSFVCNVHEGMGGLLVIE